MNLAFLNPWREAKILRDENQRLKNALADPLLTGMNIGKGAIEIGLQSPAAALVAGMFLSMFENAPDAKNYIECMFSSKSGAVLVTVVRPQGKTPHQLRCEAEEKLSALQALMERNGWVA